MCRNLLFFVSKNSSKREIIVEKMSLDTLVNSSTLPLVLFGDIVANPHPPGVSYYLKDPFSSHLVNQNHLQTFYRLILPVRKCGPRVSLSLFRFRLFSYQKVLVFRIDLHKTSHKITESG
jgi:hypothetical protein